MYILLHGIYNISAVPVADPCSGKPHLYSEAVR